MPVSFLPPENPPKRILMVRPSALGDVARTVGCLATLRRAYPRAEVHWLVNRAFADAVRHHPMLNDVVRFERHRAGSLPALMASLRRSGYDLVVDLQGLARSGLLTWCTRAGRRVGFADAREMGWLGYNVRHRVDASVVHTVDRMHGLLAADGLTVEPDLRLYVGDEDAAWRDAWAAEQGVTAGGYACVAPTAQWGCKCWPVERYTELARRLAEHPATAGRVVVLAAPHEHARLSPLIDALGERAVLPETTVGRLMAVIQGAAVLVCNDSAPLHLAVGLDRPTVSLFGPTDPAKVGPYVWTGQPDRHRVLRAAGAAGQTFNYRAHRDDDTLIAEVPTDQVWQAVADQLQR